MKRIEFHYRADLSAIFMHIQRYKLILIKIIKKRRFKS